MYIPESFRAKEQDHLLEVIRQNPFGTLVNQSETGLFATHIPFLVEQTSEGKTLLKAHLARANPHWKTLLQGTEALLIFQGGDAYISPTWYEQHPSVPTWNYVAVHAYGTATMVEGEAFRTLLMEEIHAFEQGLEEPWEPHFTEEYWERMMRGIVGISIEVTRIEGKFKLGQNRSKTDRQTVRNALQNQKEPTTGQKIALWMDCLEKDSEA